MEKTRSVRLQRLVDGRPDLIASLVVAHIVLSKWYRSTGCDQSDPVGERASRGYRLDDGGFDILEGDDAALAGERTSSSPRQRTTH